MDWPAEGIFTQESRSEIPAQFHEAVEKVDGEGKAFGPSWNLSEDETMSKAHPGFWAVQRKIAKKYGRKKASAILASASRHASKKAKRKNPRLKRVK